ncbi:MAG: hypothetical protein ACTSRP_07985, partial [Candidatus Helarchaeota archaeon]
LRFTNKVLTKLTKKNNEIDYCKSWDEKCYLEISDRIKKIFKKYVEIEKIIVKITGKRFFNLIGIFPN